MTAAPAHGEQASGAGTVRPRLSGIIGNGRRKLSRIAGHIRAALRRLRDCDELLHLSDRELRDMGLTRYDIVKARRAWWRSGHEPYDR
jgi:uncharacterized protein YjiS (DUF1127 family)